MLSSRSIASNRPLTIGSSLPFISYSSFPDIFNCRETETKFNNYRFIIHILDTMKIFFTFFLICLTPVFLNARANNNRTDYIKEYSEVAIQQMRAFKIPASITLAQGILESGSGNSFLARSSNNHFNS